MAELTHTDERGHVRMVDVGEKTETRRSAIARGYIRLSPEAFESLVHGKAAKGDVLATARIAGIMAAKRTPEIIPLCHHIALSSVKVDLRPVDGVVHIKVEVKATDRTGAEMQALTAVSAAALTIYDMLKAIDKTMRIGGIELVEKKGGRSGTYRPTSSRRSVNVIPKLSAPEFEPEANSTLIEEPEQTIDEVMTSPPLPSSRARALTASVEGLSQDDPELVVALRRTPVESAYMLGDLDQPYAEHASWYGLREDSALKGVMLLYSGLSVPTVLTRGGPTEVEALLSASKSALPRRFYAHIHADHRRPLEVFYDFRRIKHMMRMGLTKDHYRPVGDSADVVQLGHADTGAIMKLYRHYPDNFFDPAQLDSGLYFGLREGKTLASVAGIHVFSEKHDVAAIGNIVTHRDHRAKGLATRCVRRLLDELFAKVGHVALNVEAINAPAISCYAKFGFTERYKFLEGYAALR